MYAISERGVFEGTDPRAEWFHTDVMTMTSDQKAPLSAADRCDRCGAQAYVRVALAGGELLFCAHHGAKVKEKLAPTALEWHDESSRLTDDR